MLILFTINLVKVKLVCLAQILYLHRHFVDGDRRALFTVNKTSVVWWHHADGRPRSLVVQVVDMLAVQEQRLTPLHRCVMVRCESLSNQIKSSPYAIKLFNSHDLIVSCRASIKFKSSHDLLDRSLRKLELSELPLPSCPYLPQPNLINQTKYPLYIYPAA